MAPAEIDHSFEVLPDRQAVRQATQEQHIRISTELAGFPVEAADAFITRGLDPYTVARLLERALRTEQ